MMKKINNKGFSLVELIIVIAIMAIIVGVVTPAYLKYVEKSRIAADMVIFDNIYKAFKTELAVSEYNDETLFTDCFGGETSTNHMIDMNVKGEQIIQVNQDGTISFPSNRVPANFEEGEFVYDVLKAAGVDCRTLKTKKRLQVFKSNALKKAVKKCSSNGYCHIMVAVTPDEKVLVWLGSRGYQDKWVDGERVTAHSAKSMPDVRFSAGRVFYKTAADKNASLYPDTDQYYP
ncbi:MAG: prepilin-type N-terminal cleavage/methylation domain-containing protein [Lachnospiraceae bacterium]|nr:prepilin-type N-terminal cleavage/methylation domain-containing protein [Lachnospiraceae bacterium]